MLKCMNSDVANGENFYKNDFFSHIVMMWYPLYKPLPMHSRSSSLSTGFETWKKNSSWDEQYSQKQSSANEE